MTWIKLIDGGGSGFERDLLGSARDDVAPSGARERVAERLGFGVVGSSSIEPTASAPGKPEHAIPLARRLLSRPGIERYRAELERLVSGEEKSGSPRSPRDIGSAR